MPLTANDILAMIAAGEGQTVEFKRDISQRSDTAGELMVMQIANDLIVREYSEAFACYQRALELNPVMILRRLMEQQH